MKRIACCLMVLASFASAFAQSPPAKGNPAPQPLSEATRAKIARMRPIFDGRTLDGWIQAPPAPITFSAYDLLAVPSLIQKLKSKPDPISAFLATQLDEPARTALVAFGPGGDEKPVVSALVRNLNRIIASGEIDDGARFDKVLLRDDTLALQRTHPQGDARTRLNRLLLEDALSTELRRSPATSWVVKDGAMASTGAGRGVIYTADDYTHYRLVFTMRHVSGQPDHQPCVLVFCQRPPPGERGLDALGAIQFQTPNGGHWDYRPGQNKAGSGFVRPVRTTFDNHEWHQVEILVDARTGRARMAVAQPVGTRAVENLVFDDRAAGRKGPIAWQMHNAGLFDEFKDVRIEVDPAEDRLITVE